MEQTKVAPLTRVGSPIDNGRRAGRAPNTPDSYTSQNQVKPVRRQVAGDVG